MKYFYLYFIIKQYQLNNYFIIKMSALPEKALKVNEYYIILFFLGKTQ
jgi:hypothetical protein